MRSRGPFGFFPPSQRDCWVSLLPGKRDEGVEESRRGWGRAVCRGSPACLPLQVSTVRMQGVILLLFAKYYHLPFLRDVQTDCTRTGLGGYWVSGGGPECGWQDSPLTHASFAPRPTPTQAPSISSPRPIPSLALSCPSLLFLSLEFILA